MLFQPTSKAVQSGGPAPSGLSDEERDTYEKLKEFFATDVAYALEMGTRPQTLYGIADSPVGLAAWILDHDMVSYELIARVFDGHAEGLTRDDILDNITHYWLTNTGVSSGRIYWENKLGFYDVKDVRVPVAVSVFPDEVDAAPRSWARDDAHPNSLEGVRGAQVYTRAADLPTVKLDSVGLPGVELRGRGSYVIAPPSVHPSGATYEGEVVPTNELRGMAGKVRELVRSLDDVQLRMAPENPGDKIAEGARHETLLSLAGRPAAAATTGRCSGPTSPL